MRIGQGFDAHRLVEDGDLIIGGVKIPFEKGLLGHSDADVLVHAVCDAVLGAAGLGDMGRHFPDSDPAYRNMDSLKLLARVRDMAAEKGLGLIHLDATIIAQRPKMAPHMDAMRRNIAGVLKMTPERVNIKATTTEGMGAMGRGSGIAAMCVVLLNRDDRIRQIRRNES